MLNTFYYEDTIWRKHGVIQRREWREMEHENEKCGTSSAIVAKLEIALKGGRSNRIGKEKIAFWRHCSWKDLWVKQNQIRPKRP